MPISPPSTVLQQSSVPVNTATSGNPATLPRPGRSSGASASGTPAQNTQDSADSVRITLTPPHAAQSTEPELAPPYAEIWKDGVKVAVVDSHGGVNSVNGLVPSVPGNSSSDGGLIAARRAAEIARAIGGEIRVAGQTVDGATLDMRAKLKRAYGA